MRTQTVDALRQDVTFAARTLFRRGGWTLIVVLTLALGIGANTAVFSIVDHVLLRPLAYPDADRLVLAMLEMRPPRTLTVNPRPEMIEVWRRDTRTLEAIEGVGGSEITYQGRGSPPEVLAAAHVTPTFADFAGVRPIHGRGLTESDAGPNAEPVVALAEGTWRSRFGGDRGVLGTRIMLDGRSHVIVGVYPSRLGLPSGVQERTEVWVPADLPGALEEPDSEPCRGQITAASQAVMSAAQHDRVEMRSLAHAG